MERTVDFPRNVFNKSFGLGLDYGGSALKMLYTTQVEDKIRVHFVTTSSERHDEAFKLLADKCKGKLEPGTEVFTCGVGASQHLNEMKETLQLNITNTSEIDRLVEGFTFLSRHQPWREFVQGPSHKMVKSSANIMKEVAMFLTAWATGGKLRVPPFSELHEVLESGQIKPAAPEGLDFPVIVALVGSATGYLLLEKDGSYSAAGGGALGGKSLLGLGSLLTGAKTFDDLCGLAEKGNQAKVDTFAGEFNNIDPNDKNYNFINEMTMKAFPFGQAVGKKRADFQPEDMAMSLLDFMAEYIGNDAYNIVLLTKVKQLIFIGGFPCTNQLIQDQIARQFYVSRLLSNHACDCYFMKNGEHCGSFGTLLMNMGNNTKD